MGVADGGPNLHRHAALIPSLAKAAEQLLPTSIELRKTVHPLGDASGLAETLRAGLHALVDEAIDATDYVSAVSEQLARWDAVAFNRRPLMA